MQLGAPSNAWSKGHLVALEKTKRDVDHHQFQWKIRIEKIQLGEFLKGVQPREYFFDREKWTLILTLTSSHARILSDGLRLWTLGAPYLIESTRSRIPTSQHWQPIHRINIIMLEELFLLRVQRRAFGWAQFICSEDNSSATLCRSDKCLIVHGRTWVRLYDRYST